jgi:CBS domain-containing protein
MNVSDLMQCGVATVRCTDGLDAAAELMRERACGSVVVTDGNRKPLAMLTDRDVCLALLRTGKSLAALRVADAMSASLHRCRWDDPIAKAEEIMGLHQVRRLPVVDVHGRLVGLLSLDDIAREASREQDLLAPPVSCAAVGRTLGEIARAKLVDAAPG